MNNDWIRRDSCRLCHSTDLHPFLSMGEIALAGAFLKPDQVCSEKKYPLTVCFCRTCSEIQILETVDPAILFKDYRYLASSTKTLSRHFQDYARTLVERFLQPGSLVVEIGSNDGVLLEPLKALGLRAVGVEPAGNIAAAARSKGCDVYNDFFGPALAPVIRAAHGPADAICANNVFAHIDDIHSVMQGVDHLLASDGIFIFEVQCLFDLIDGCQYDMIYHEHLMYHSLHALERFFSLYEMQVFDVIRIPTHCGSIRVHVQRNKSPRIRPREKRVADFIEEEQRRGFNRSGTFDDFGKTVHEKSAFLRDMIGELSSEGKTIAGYGASGRASVHVNLSRLGTDKLAYVVDSSPERAGRVMPGTHNPITGPEFFRENPPDYALVFAYNYLEEITSKETAFTAAGGKWIVPLPKARILS